MWGLAPVFAASPAQIKTLRKDKNYAELKMISLPEVVADHPRLDLLHIDIQGGETNLIRDSIDILNRRVAYIVVGTHSRVIDGEIIDILQLGTADEETGNRATLLPSLFTTAGRKRAWTAFEDGINAKL